MNTKLNFIKINYQLKPRINKSNISQYWSWKSSLWVSNFGRGWKNWPKGIWLIKGKQNKPPYTDHCFQNSNSFQIGHFGANNQCPCQRTSVEFNKRLSLLRLCLRPFHHLRMTFSLRRKECMCMLGSFGMNVNCEWIIWFYWSFFSFKQQTTAFLMSGSDSSIRLIAAEWKKKGKENVL